MSEIVKIVVHVGLEINENLGITAHNIDIFTMVILGKKGYLHKISTSPNLDFLRLNEKFDESCLIYAVFKVSLD